MPYLDRLSRVEPDFVEEVVTEELSPHHSSLGSGRFRIVTVSTILPIVPVRDHG